ncbi:hypothetical protein [Tropicimonas sp. S265A]|uniref:hypothetical protein n=1 Tax=Tropicimonas sp. S265A TaxID=3415134 RepID=UPI003C7E72F6
MSSSPPAPSDPTVCAVVQNGRLTYEAVIFCASFRAANPDYAGRLILLEPAPGPLWPDDPTVQDPDARFLLETEFGAEIVPFTAELFGARYPNGNKIEALSALPADTPFVFFDTDTLHLGPLGDVPFDFARPSASMKRTGTWPKPSLYGPGHTEIWKSLYDRFDLDFETSLDLRFPEGYWERYLYFNAGWFYGACPQAFGARFREIAGTIDKDPPAELVGQSFDPWLDQIALPLVIHSLGGGRDPSCAGLLDGRITCHYRLLPLLYAREADEVVETLERVVAPNRIKKVLKGSEAAKRMIYQGKGAKARALFDRDNLPVKEAAIRNRLKREKLWLR